MGKYEPERMEVFLLWVEAHYPGTHLTPMQEQWAQVAVGHHCTPSTYPLWAGGRRTGKTFVTKLVKEFLGHG